MTCLLSVFNQPGEGGTEEAAGGSAATAAPTAAAPTAAASTAAASTAVAPTAAAPTVATTAAAQTDTPPGEDVVVQTEHTGSIPVQGEVTDQSTQAVQQMNETPQQTEKQVIMSPGW